MRLSKTFGVGPSGIVLSAVLLGVAYQVERYIPLPPLFNGSTIPNAALAGGVVFSILMVIWSVRSLPVGERGHGVCTSGAYRYVRHPVYAAFSSIGALGLALYFNHPVFLLWFVAIQLLWRWLVRSEEQMMVREFGEEYELYMERTGRLFPRLGKRRSKP
jgi:protein-S-isoprenylcysteine O-methyltransferase Ste14